MGSKCRRLQAVFGSPPGGELYQPFQPMTSYLWRVERGWNLAKYFNDVNLLQLRRTYQFEKLCLCGEEDRPFRYPSPVRRVPEPDCKAEIRLCGNSFFHFGWWIPVCEFEGIWRIVGH